MQNTILGMFKPEAVPKPPPLPDGGYLLVDLFCSIGGVSQAAKNLGHKVVLAIDYEAERLEVHRNNHPDCHHECIELGAEAAELSRPKSANSCPRRSGTAVDSRVRRAPAVWNPLVGEEAGVGNLRCQGRPAKCVDSCNGRWVIVVQTLRTLALKR